MSKEIAEEYASSLADLTVNSKPLINMLTILAEENIDHAGVIVETVEKHLEKVHPEIKLPVLYLVDSIIKNVGGAYTQKFSQSIVNMFTRTFKQVDEKTRSQMFKLRETWHDVFPATKLYQLDVKVNLIDPAWPIQAQPQQSNIHTVPTTSTAQPVLSEEERNIIAKKEQELLMLQKKKIEMELEQTRKQLELAEKNAKKITTTIPTGTPSPAMPIALVNPVVPPVMAVAPEVINTPIKQRLGPPVNKTSGRIAPVSAALISARRDPRLARRQPPPLLATPLLAPLPPTPVPVTGPVVAPLAAAPIAPNVFDIKPLERAVTKRKNVITIDVRTDVGEVRQDPRRRDPNPSRSQREPRRERVRPRRRVPAERDPAPPPSTLTPTPETNHNVDAYIEKLQLVDPRRINKLPPIPKINRDEQPPGRDRDAPAPPKRRKEGLRDKKKKGDNNKEGLVSGKGRENKKKREPRVDTDPAEAPGNEIVQFKELKNYHKERYMRRNKEKSESPERAPEAKEMEKSTPEPDASNVPEVIVENKDVDLRVLHSVVETHAAPVVQKRPSTETLEGKTKKAKIDKFDILFGNEDVDLRKLPQVEEVSTAPPASSITESPNKDEEMNEADITISPTYSPKQKDWHEVKEKRDKSELKKTPSKLDLVRAKLAEATKGKDRLGRPLLFSKSPSVEKERRRTLSSEDTDIRHENGEDFDTEDNKKTISIIMSQAKEQYSDGQLDKNQYNTLMYQVLQLNEKLKLKEAKQRESLEVSKRKLKAHLHDENNKVPSPKSSPNELNNFGDIDERVNSAVFIENPPDFQGYLQDSDMRNNHNVDGVDGPKMKGLLPRPPMAMAMGMYGPFQPMWRGQIRPRPDEFMPRRFRGPVPPFFRGKFRPNFDVRPPMPLPTPKIGMSQGECPLKPYERSESPPPLGAPGLTIPPTDFKILEYIDQDPVKTIQIDGVPREIRFYDDTAVIMLDWDDPREIKFLPGCRRVTFDNKDSVVLSFNEGYKQVEIDDQVFDIKFGAPTRELYINGKWYECFFGSQPLGVIIDGKPRLVHLEGPLPQVDIGKTKRTDLVAGKINLIVNATQMCPVYLDAKVQKFAINGQFFTIRFVDSLKTVLINEQPFKIEFGDLPKPITVGNEKYFIRFSALPRNIKPGVTQIAGMEGATVPSVAAVTASVDVKETTATEDQDIPRPVKTPSPDMNTESQGLEMLASVMPSSIAPASASEYSLAEPLFTKPDKIPGLETPADEKPNPVLPILSNINVTDLFAKLVASGIVHVPSEPKKEEKTEPVAEEANVNLKEDKNVIRNVDWFKPESFRGKQPGIVSKLYGGMQCSGCGTRFPPEHTVRYSQHLDWHFRQNRRERDSARRAHSRHWHYDLSDWLQYEELEELDEREKNWFENGGLEGAGEGGATGAAGAPGAEPCVDAPSVAAGPPHSRHCALCGDCFDQFYNEDKEEWHLRNSLTHEDKYYHPLCFEDYKASLTKEEPKIEEIAPDTKIQDEAIEIKDVDESAEQSDNESVVEVVEPNDVELLEPVEIDEGSDAEGEGEGVVGGEGEAEGDEDDVVLKAEPIEEVVVQDDADTDEETTAERADRDRRALIDFSNVRIKQEPIDPDDEPIITAEEENILSGGDMMHTTVLSSIDGNTQLESTSAPLSSLPLGGIRINITKSIPSAVHTEDRMLDDVSADEEPLPPGEEPELEYKLKPSLEGVQFSRQPPLMKDKELSGLCSIM